MKKSVMNVDLKHILIFKTNIQNLDDKQKIQLCLDSQKEIQKWSVDIDDVDRVLRVVSFSLQPKNIIELLHHNGFSCSELD